MRCTDPLCPPVSLNNLLTEADCSRLNCSTSGSRSSWSCGRIPVDDGRPTASFQIPQATLYLDDPPDNKSGLKEERPPLRVRASRPQWVLTRPNQESLRRPAVCRCAYGSICLSLRVCGSMTLKDTKCGGGGARCPVYHYMCRSPSDAAMEQILLLTFVRFRSADVQRANPTRRKSPECGTTQPPRQRSRSEQDLSNLKKIGNVPTQCRLCRSAASP